MSGKNLQSPAKKLIFQWVIKADEATQYQVFPPPRQEVSDRVRWREEKEGCESKRGDVGYHPFCFHRSFLPAFLSW